MEVEGGRLPASAVCIPYADQLKKTVFMFFVQEEGKCLMKYCGHSFSHFFFASLKEYEKRISWAMMFDRLSLVSLWNETILQSGFLTCYLAKETDLESFGFPLCRLFEYNGSTCCSNVVLIYMGKSIIR